MDIRICYSTQVSNCMHWLSVAAVTNRYTFSSLKQPIYELTVLWVTRLGWFCWFSVKSLRRPKSILGAAKVDLFSQASGKSLLLGPCGSGAERNLQVRLGFLFSYSWKSLAFPPMLSRWSPFYSGGSLPFHTWRFPSFCHISLSVT